MKKNLRDSYKLYKTVSGAPVDVKIYLKIVAEYNKFLISKVLNGAVVTLPARLGTLRIIGRKQEIKYDEQGNVMGLAPDWVKTKQLWDKSPKAKENRKLVYHTNNHTEGVIYRFFWSKKNVLVENKNLFSLRLTRTNKREVNKLLIEGTQYEIKPKKAWSL